MVEILAIVRNPKAGFLCFNLYRMGQTQIPKLEVMSISLTVSRNVYQLRAACAT
jgi:hypothetical protein